MTIIEIIATIFGVLCVWLTMRQNIWCWPAGLVQVLLFIWIFLQVKLYSDVGLHVIYVGLCLYGWWYWLHGGLRRQRPPVTRLTKRAVAGWLVLAAVGTTALGWTMASFTYAALPYWDAATTVLSLIAQCLMARKRLESWLFWIVVDVLAVGIYIAKGLYVTSGLYILFLGLAIAGWLAWKQSLTSTSADPVAACSSESSCRRTADTSSSSTSPDAMSRT